MESLEKELQVCQGKSEGAKKRRRVSQGFDLLALMLCSSM